MRFREHCNELRKIEEAKNEAIRRSMVKGTAEYEERQRLLDELLAERDLMKKLRATYAWTCKDDEIQNCIGIDGKKHDGYNYVKAGIKYGQIRKVIELNKDNASVQSFAAYSVQYDKLDYLKQRFCKKYEDILGYPALFTAIDENGNQYRKY